MAIFIVSSAANADDMPPPYDDHRAPGEARDWLLGDWNGVRSQLLDRGLSFQFGYVNQLAYNVRGGTKKELASADQYSIGSHFDLDKHFGAHNAQFQISFALRTGRNLSDDAELGTLQEVQEIFGRGRTARLTEFWFEQSFFHGLVDWKVGRSPFEDFASFSCDFQNLAFCGPGPGNVVPEYIWVWPISQWMTRFKFSLSESSSLKVALYDQNIKYLGTGDALTPAFFSESSGVLIPVEFGWLPSFYSGSLPGSYKVGVWYDTSNALDAGDASPISISDPGRPAKLHSGRYGGYINFRQSLWVDAERGNGISAFLNAVVADERTSRTDRQVTGGVNYSGVFSGRPDDDLAFAIGATHLNDRVASAASQQAVQAAAPRTEGKYEYTVELYYTVHPADGLFIRPNIQFVLNPGGTDEHADVAIFGLKTVVHL